MKHLTDLSKIDNDNFTRAFMTSLQTVYQYGALDIQEELQKTDMDNLSILHKTLCERIGLCTIFPQYTDKKPITRKIKRTICSNIFHLGYSIVNRKPARKLDKIFSSKDCDQGDVDNQVGPETEMATLFQVVSDLTRRMRVVEKRLATVEAQKEELEKLTKLHESTDKETDSHASDTRRFHRVEE